MKTITSAIHAARAFRALLTALLTALLALPLAACDEDTAEPGEPGGACLIGSAPCVEGYGCVNGVCTAVDAEVALPSYRAEIEFDRERVEADGADAVEFFFTVTRVDADGRSAPYDPEADGALFITTSPLEAGRIEPARPALLDGLGVATFVPCDRARDAICPPSAIIRIARDEAPTSPIGESGRFLLVDPAPEMPDAGADAAP